MITTALGRVAEIVGGTPYDVEGVDVTAPATLDSRRVESGGLFVAVRGEHVDGHDFAPAAYASGAAAVLGERRVDGPCVVVDDVEAALARLARDVRDRLDGCVVVGVTGSQGKTSVKDLLAQVLDASAPTVATAGNYNNELGVPLTVLRAEAATRYLVVEMGARAVGNIAALCAIARPDIGVVLNVGTAHVGEFGSVEAIARTKGELVESLPAHGVAVLNADDPAVAAMRSRTVATVRTYGTTPGADVVADDVRVGDDGEPRFVLRADGLSAAVHVPLLGAHQASNAAAATAAALAAGLSLDSVVEALAHVTNRSAWRMERSVRSDGLMVVNDAYNANPESVAAALRAVVAMAHGRRVVTVLGEMLELGGAAGAAHASVGSLAADLGVTQVVAVGVGARQIHEAAAAAGADSVLVDDLDDALAWLRGYLRAGDIVLVKASRASGLERLAAALLAETDPQRRVADAESTSGEARDDEGNDAR
ncbi:UDP-N-acetylmuramoyl-tripeptide--D-alanyl-D-alanine ligase [Mumia sp. ZJ1417]|uniref:UDP-N-acetylmuramoyl-tripeptide--D-alanyl-D- alanine ligase n=1 Tax=Mumia sp. ZJ1417 TaxID=2708082 RepID=UPI0014204A02|nr:UDP-N-acetylmuramoyl-tripeptide--D-alanyl-D-alanine ligase [Mumia sp. ZJ1417]QMW67765.1 UDP-N-acetylmuramoyl-tripeptide--D-alanyl-D-alanine ligase [Mumia sp. ZJ1417]